MKYKKVKGVGGTLDGLNRYLVDAVKQGWQPIGPMAYTNNRLIGRDLEPTPYYIITLGMPEE